VVALLYLIAVAFLLIQERGLVYAARWSHSGLDTLLLPGWRRATIFAQDGTRLDAVVVTPVAPPRATVMYLHGNAASIWSAQVRDKLRAYQQLDTRCSPSITAAMERGRPRNGGWCPMGSLDLFAEDSLGVEPGALLIHGCRWDRGRRGGRGHSPAPAPIRRCLHLLPMSPRKVPGSRSGC
jgi:hypothetical protein